MVTPSFVAPFAPDAVSSSSAYGIRDTVADLVEASQDLPDAMRTARRWLLWKEVPVEGKKARKVPFYADGHPRGSGIELDSAEDQARLVSLEAALGSLALASYSGLAFALGPDDRGGHWQGIDLDDLPGRPELQALVDDLPGYTERSPSGRGVHAIGYGAHFPSMGSNGSGIEAYSSGRFFTVTCDGAGLHEPADLSAFVEERLRPMHRRSSECHSESPPVCVDPRTVSELRSALLSMRSDDRDLWIRMGHALKTLGNAGRGLWMEWSAQSVKFDSADAARTWESMKPVHTGHQAVFAEAQRQGWVNPLSASAQPSPGRSEGTPWLPPSSGGESAVAADLVPALALGSSLVDLSDLGELEQQHPHVVEKIIPQGEVTLLSGHGGGGKSFASLVLLIHVALGRPFCGLQTSRTRVVFFSAEDDGAEIKRRVNRVCRLLAINRQELVGWLHVMDVSEMDPTLFTVDKSGRGMDTQLLEELGRYVSRHDIGLTVIDNASDVFDGDEVNRKQVRAFIRAVRKHVARPRRAVLLLSHVSKASVVNRRAGVSSSEDYSGSTAWHNSVRSRLSLNASKDGGCVHIEHLKANKGPRADPILLEWREGAPVPRGECVGASLAEILQRDAAREQDEAFKKIIVEIIEDFDRRGERVPQSMRGINTVFKALSGSISPRYPDGLAADRLNRLVRELEQEGRVFRTHIYTPNRKWVECFTCSKVLVASALNAQPPTSLAGQPKAAPPPPRA